MKRLQTLYDRRSKLHNERREAIEAFNAVLDAAGDELSDAERAKADEIEARIATLETQYDEIEADIRREERARTYRNEMTELPDDAPQRIDAIRDRGEDDPNRGFANVADFALSVREAGRPGGVIDGRLLPQAAPTNFHRESGFQDGYMVPPAMASEIWELVYTPDGDEEILNQIEFEDTESNVVTLTTDESTPWGATGIQANWRSEGAQLTASRLETDQEQVRLQNLDAYVLVTEELTEDAPRLNQRLTNGASRAIRWEMGEAFVRGDGVGKPLGWMNSPALITVSEETSQTAVLVSENLGNMYARQLDIAGAIWLINSELFPYLVTLTIGDQPVYLPGANLANAPFGLLFGRPVFWSEHAAGLDAAGDIMFVSLRMMHYYATRRREGIRFAQSIHLFFDYGVQAFRWSVRLNGQPILSAPVTPNLGSATKSYFVTLQGGRV